MSVTVKPKSSARTYTIIKMHRGRVSKQTGTIQELIEYFHYTLECGNGWNHSISLNPRGGRALVNALNKCVRELQGGCFNQDHYELES
jgi:hypothetical protein